ncbi:MAG: hypothetical protein AAF688_13735 [Bacteroidota bacterium]
MSERGRKIIRLYVTAILCIVGYVFFENTDISLGWIENSRRFRYSGFPQLIFTGILKYGLLFLGLGITVITSFFLIKNK